MPFSSLSLANSLALDTPSASSLTQRLSTWVARISRTAEPPPAPDATPGHELKAILSRHPRARAAFPALAEVEAHLFCDGIAGLQRLSHATVNQARGELLAITGEAEASTLLALLDRRCETWHGDTQRCAPPVPAASHPAAPDLPSAMSEVEITEATPEAFQEALRAWEASEICARTRGLSRS